LLATCGWIQGRRKPDFGTGCSKDEMTGATLPLQFLAAWLAVWLGRALQEQVEYLKAENQLLREKLGARRVRLPDAERRRLATVGKVLGRKGCQPLRPVHRLRRFCAGTESWWPEIRGSEQRGTVATYGRTWTIAHIRQSGVITSQR
jgi:hypothetical protein